MKKLLAFMLITFVSTAPLSAKDAFGARNETKAKTAFGKQAKKSPFLVSFGTNLSSFSGEEGDWQLGYNLGLTFNRHLYKNLSITLPLSYTRINTAPKNVEGKSYGNDGFIYRAFIDREISVGFLEFPILLSYNFSPTKKYETNYLLGFGLVLAAKDFSKVVQPEDVTITNEIIGTHDFPLDPVDTRFFIPNSGININTGVRFHVSRFYIDILYTLYPYTIKEINKLNSISLRLGIDIF